VLLRVQKLGVAVLRIQVGPQHPPGVVHEPRAGEMADVPAGGTKAATPVGLLREEEESFVEEAHVGERVRPDEEKRADEPVRRDLPRVGSLVHHVLAQTSEAGKPVKEEGLSGLPRRGGKAADRVLKAPVRPELNRACHADLGSRVHGLDEVFEGARDDFDVRVQKKDVAASCLRKGDVVPRREAHIRDPCHVQIREPRLDRIRCAVAGAAVDEEPLDGDLAERRLHGFERLERTLSPLVRDDDD
jgi:hypothetical protein